MKILWFVSELNQAGGGDRFALEAVKALTEAGHDVLLVSDRVGVAASFSGKYSLDDVVCLFPKSRKFTGYIDKVQFKLRGLFSLIKVARAFRPDLLVCQSEFDAIKVGIVSVILRKPYRVYIFGQMFQFKNDISKFSLIFKSRLKQVLDSSPGYARTLGAPPRPSKVFQIVANEIISCLKYYYVRAANQIFVLSEQIQWEVLILYRKEAAICRAAISETDINVGRIAHPTSVRETPTFISICRLTAKKRVKLIVEGFIAAECTGVLVVVGDGPERAGLERIALNSAKTDQVKFLGIVDDEERVSLLQDADCFISMDVAEYNISVIEAMSTGLRTIVAGDYDMSTLGPLVTGIAQVEASASSLASAINSVGVMSNPTVANIEALQQLTWQQLATKCCANMPS